MSKERAENRYTVLMGYISTHKTEWIGDVLRWVDHPDYGDSVQSEEDAVKAVKEAQQILMRETGDMDLALVKDLALFIFDFSFDDAGNQIEGT